MASVKNALSSASTDLDRAPLDTYTATKTHQQDGRLNQRLRSIDEDPKESSGDTESKVRAKVRHVTTKVKSKLHVKKEDETFIHGDQRVIDEAADAPILAPPPPTRMDDDRYFKPLPEKPSRHSLKEVVTVPVKTLKSIAGRQGGNAYAENLAKTDVTHGANVNIVRAYENIASATTTADRESAIQDIEQLKKSRQDSFVRWTMDRHVQKVRRIQTIKLPRQSMRDFVEKIDDVKQTLRWKEYGHYLLRFYLEYYGTQYIGVYDQLPKPTESAIISSFERVILTSAPYQNFLMATRDISLWKQPKYSAGYMAVYLVLWWYDCLTVFVVSLSFIASAVKKSLGLLRAFYAIDLPPDVFQLLALLGMVVKRRYYRPTVEELREDLERSENAESTALNISQLIEQHGTHGWVDPLIEKAGPSVLSQLEDLADFLEVLRNFYEWRDPNHTAMTMGILTFMSLIVITTSSRLLMKGALLALGGTFFLLSPIWHLHPHYSLLASPLKWVFWKIPTHAEWAIARLQAEAAYQLREMQSAASRAKNDQPASKEEISNHVEAASLLDTDARLIGRYHCTCRNRHGNLTVTTDEVSFKQDLTKDRSWRLGYNQIKAMQKIVGSSTISSGDDLLFIDLNDNEYRTAGLSARDEVFTQIIGYSKLQWQVTA